MIFYATRETRERYRLKTPDEMQLELGQMVRQLASKERGSRVYEWGCKLFYFDRRKCLQIMHFESKLVIFLANVKVKDMEYTGNAVAHYLMDLYSADAAMSAALERFFASSPLVCFDKLTDRSIITRMNGVQNRWAWDGHRFYKYLRDGILHTREINRDVNQMPVIEKVDGKDAWFIPYERFAEIIQKRFGKA